MTVQSAPGTATDDLRAIPFRPQRRVVKGERPPSAQQVKPSTNDRAGAVKLQIERRTAPKEEYTPLDHGAQIGAQESP